MKIMTIQETHCERVSNQFSNYSNQPAATNGPLLIHYTFSELVLELGTRMVKLVLGIPQGMDGFEATVSLNCKLSSASLSLLVTSTIMGVIYTLDVAPKQILYSNNNAPGFDWEEQVPSTPIHKYLRLKGWEPNMRKRSGKHRRDGQLH